MCGGCSGGRGDNEDTLRLDRNFVLVRLLRLQILRLSRDVQDQTTRARPSGPCGREGFALVELPGCAGTVDRSVPKEPSCAKEPSRIPRRHRSAAARGRRGSARTVSSPRWPYCWHCRDATYPSTAMIPTRSTARSTFRPASNRAPSRRSMVRYASPPMRRSPARPPSTAAYTWAITERPRRSTP